MEINKRESFGNEEVQLENNCLGKKKGKKKNFVYKSCVCQKDSLPFPLD